MTNAIQRTSVLRAAIDVGMLYLDMPGCPAKTPFGKAPQRPATGISLSPQA
ncbi:hypothetical protein SAMN05421666_3275 [Roseovarius nanhaiticus]|uniref:Uncharacterized protein n=1 Tax=Roseovarius nanhaiticus TaxID=573024 RepID=A0A1N7HL74_9RHOB|nr:hypothetical protein SAMN05216208_3251 [Roseovarius nanhaiticus]SIS25420.1 hypothetical protein SAMN05421666_3275 [Roseovarius nanhaiticus]